MSLSIFYVYKYIDDNGIPYYIGKGSKNRINDVIITRMFEPGKELAGFISGRKIKRNEQ